MGNPENYRHKINVTFINFNLQLAKSPISTA